MKVGVRLDGVLADSFGRLELYKKSLEVNSDFLLHPRLIGDNSFWAGMSAYLDISFFMQALVEGQHELYVLTERPTSLFSVTRAWLRRKGICLPDDHLITNSLLRFDCRMLNIDVLINADGKDFEKFSYDRVQPIQICRKDHSEADHRSQDLSYPVIHNLKESLQYHANVQSPWAHVHM